MLQEIKNTLKVLDNLNKQKKYIDQRNIHEKYDNIEDMAKTIEKLYKNLQYIESSNIENKETITNILLQLHHIYIDLIWHFGQIDDLIAAIIKQENER